MTLADVRALRLISAFRITLALVGAMPDRLAYGLAGAARA